MTRLTLVINLVCKAAALSLLLFGANLWLAIAFFVGPDLYLLYHMLVPSAQGLVRVHTRFETERREVWLTIDDGPDERDTPMILDLLDRHRARATFFVVGVRAARHPELVAEILRRGNEVAHHTQSHPAGTFWSAFPSRVGRELDECAAVLARSGVRPRWFRAPAGIKNLFLRSALRKRGLIYIGWSDRGRDCVSRDPERVAVRILKRVKPGAIILMHEGPGVHDRVRIEALSRLLDGLEARNLACVLPGAEQLS
jgi:peptidoglycan/xylan/chitin deacetylase (PgdA/CDA1 family)